MVIFRGAMIFFLLGFRGGLSKISPNVKEGIRGPSKKFHKNCHHQFTHF